MRESIYGVGVNVMSEIHELEIPGFGNVKIKRLEDMSDVDVLDAISVFEHCIQEWEEKWRGYLEKAKYSRDVMEALVGSLYWHCLAVNSIVLDVEEEEEEEESCGFFSSFQRTSSDIEKILKMVVIGQNEAIEKIMPIVKRACVGLSDPHRPYGVVLISGKTGTGKTLLAKALAAAAFDEGTVTNSSVRKGKNLYRIDCAELTHKSDINRLIGAPAGYVGYDNGSPLTKFVSEHPSGCVILIDEAEKADDDVLNFFLGAFDRGEIVDNQGNVIDMSRTFFVLTTNLGAREAEVEQVKNIPGFLPVQKTGYKKITMNAIKNKLSPEFRNRLDEVVIFSDLDEGSLKKIVEVERNIINERIMNRGSSIKIYESAVKEILKRADTKSFGGREIRKVMEREIVTAVASLLEEGKTGTFTVKCKKGNFVVEVKE